MSVKTYTTVELREAIAEAKAKVAEELEVELHSADDEGQDINVGCIVIEL